jgi:hypothetical protein
MVDRMIAAVPSLCHSLPQIWIFRLGLVLAATGAAAAGASETYDVFNPHPDTTRTADGRWTLHDLARPLPPRVDPVDAAELDQRSRPPAGAVVLFDGTDLSAWRLPTPRWQVVDHVLEVAPRPGTLLSQESFGSMHLHLEWATSPEPTKTGQNRGNSGVFLMSTYEIQILDTHGNRTYADGMAAAMYGMYPPDVDALRPPGEWQYYDIWFQRPIFDAEGKLVRPARVTVDVNGVRVHENRAFDGASGNRNRPPYRAHADRLPIGLQDHNEWVRFRNIWVRPLPDTEQPPHLAR